MTCKYGQLDLNQIVYGVVPSDAKNQNQCKGDKESTACDSVLKPESSVVESLKACQGNSTCTMASPKNIFVTGDQATLDANPTCSNNDETMLFIQVPCLSTDKEMNNRQV